MQKNRSTILNTLSRLQYISQGSSAYEQEINIHRALDCGAEWIQLRWKNTDQIDKLKLAQRVRLLCHDYNAICIINDSAELARQVDADGVHLGLNDQSIASARLLLGTYKIIGGTANTLADVLQRHQEGCDYIGLGPYRFTTTKEKLSPILGLGGYEEILQALQERQIPALPIFAIGGIELSDIAAIRDSGVYGVALSSVITTEPDLISTIKTQLK